jgi:hypothetical protein
MSWIDMSANDRAPMNKYIAPRTLAKREHVAEMSIGLRRPR